MGIFVLKKILKIKSVSELVLTRELTGPMVMMRITNKVV